MSGVGSAASAIAAGICFPIIDGILVGLRFYSRRCDKADLKIDDWLCIPAWLSLTGCCAALLTGTFNDIFSVSEFHDPQHRTEQEVLLAQVSAAITVFYLAANFCIKLIMLFFYRRIFVGQIFWMLSNVLLALSTVWFLYAIISWVLYCGTYLDANFDGGWAVCPAWGPKLQVGTYPIDTLIDLSLLVLPIPFVWNLQLDLKRKISLICIFILGGFAFVAGLNNTVIQFVYLIEPEIASSSSFYQGSSLLFNWPVIEIGVGLMASNLPHLSLRIARSLPKAIPRSMRVSARNTTAAISNHSRSHPYERTDETICITTKAESERTLRFDVDTERATAMDKDSFGEPENMELEEMRHQHSYGTNA